MHTFTKFIYGYDFSDKSVFPIQNNLTTSVSASLDKLYKFIEELYDYDEEIFPIKYPYSGYGDKNYYIGIDLCDNEELSAKEAVLTSEKMAKENKCQYGQEIHDMILDIINILEVNKKHNNKILSDEDMDNCISYFRELLNIEPSIIEIEACD